MRVRFLSGGEDLHLVQTHTGFLGSGLNIDGEQRWPGLLLLRDSTLEHLPANQVGEGALGFWGVGASSNPQTSHMDFAQPFCRITVHEGLQPPPCLFS